MLLNLTSEELDRLAEEVARQALQGFFNAKQGFNRMGTDQLCKLATQRVREYLFKWMGG